MDQLREFVETLPAKESPERGNAWIVVWGDRFLAGCADGHGSEFVKRERFAVATDALLAVKYRSAVTHQYQQRNDQE